MIHDACGEIYGFKTTVDMFHLKKNDFGPEGDGATSVGQFYEKRHLSRSCSRRATDYVPQLSA